MSNSQVIKPNFNRGKALMANLQKYTNQRMDCPVSGRKKCYFVPLSDIDSFAHNPARASGTRSAKVTELLDDLITDPNGQLEPICVEWNPAAGKFEIVFGCHREWATNDAYSKGYTIANHPIKGVSGIWAWAFTGSASERTALQMRENGNKKPSSPATKGEIVAMLGKYISQGGLDINPKTGLASPFLALSDLKKYERAKLFMQNNTPQWGGRKFVGVWNILSQSHNLGLNFKNYSKEMLAQYFCSNNPYGITMADLDEKLSGSVVQKGDITYGIYFVTQKSEMSGALPGNATRLKVKHKIDHMIIVCSLNNAGDTRVVKHRSTFQRDATFWNTLVHSKAFNEVFWMAQTKSETTKHILAGTWVAQITI